jgi:hypothetical protein
MDYFFNVFKTSKPANIKYFFAIGNEQFITDGKSEIINMSHVVSIASKDKCLRFNMTRGAEINFCEDSNKEAYNYILKKLF